MKRNYFIALTLFGVLLLCALVHLSAELTPLQQALKNLKEADGQLGKHLLFLNAAHWLQ